MPELIFFFHPIRTWRHHMETFSVLLAFVRGIHRWPVNSPHKGQWCRALMFSLICAWINGWLNNGDAVDLRRHRDHYDVTVMIWVGTFTCTPFLPIPYETKQARVGKLSVIAAHCYLHICTKHWHDHIFITKKHLVCNPVCLYVHGAPFSNMH